jgi:hypothetical protein
MSEDTDARGKRSGRFAEGDAAPAEAQRELLVDWVCDVFQLVCRGKGGSTRSLGVILLIGCAP